MRRSPVSWLLHQAKHQQKQQHGTLTKLQALLLQFAGHSGGALGPTNTVGGALTAESSFGHNLARVWTSRSAISDVNASSGDRDVSDRGHGESPPDGHQRQRNPGYKSEETLSSHEVFLPPLLPPRRRMPGSELWALRTSSPVATSTAAVALSGPNPDGRSSSVATRASPPPSGLSFQLSTLSSAPLAASSSASAAPVHSPPLEPSGGLGLSSPEAHIPTGTTARPAVAAVAVASPSPPPPPPPVPPKVPPSPPPAAALPSVATRTAKPSTAATEAPTTPSPPEPDTRASRWAWRPARAPPPPPSSPTYTAAVTTAGRLSAEAPAAPAPAASEGHVMEAAKPLPSLSGLSWRRPRQTRKPPFAQSQPTTVMPTVTKDTTTTTGAPTPGATPPQPSYGGVPQLVQALERGAPPVQARQLIHLMVTFSSAGKRPSLGGGQLRPREVLARLDRLMLPHLQGAYTASLSLDDLTRLFWGWVRVEVLGPSATALLHRLAATLTPTSPVRPAEYWPPLLMWTMGRLRQMAGSAAKRGAGRQHPRGGMAGAGGAAAGAEGEWRAGAGAADAAALLTQAQARLMPNLCVVLQRNAPEMNAQGVSNVFWAAGILQMKEPRDLRLLSAVGGRVATVLHQMDGQNISNAVYAVALLGLSKQQLRDLQTPYPFLDVLLGEAARRQLAGHSTQEVSNILWAVAKMGVRNRPLMAAAAEYIVKHDFGRHPTGGLATQSWSNALYGMAVQDFYDPRVVQKFAQELLGREAEELPKEYDPESGATAHQLTPQQLAATRKLLAPATPQFCSNVLYAFASLRHLDERVVDAVMDRLVAHGPTASTADIVLAVRALAQLNYRSPLLPLFLERVMPRLQADAPRLMAHNLLWALVMLGAVSDPRYGPIIRFLVATVNRHGLHGWAADAPHSFNWFKKRLEKQQRLESRDWGLTGPQYEIQITHLRGGMDELQELARQHRHVVASRLREGMVQSKVAGRIKALAAQGRIPGFLSMEEEVLLEPDLMAVDIVVRMSYDRTQMPSPCSSSSFGDASEPRGSVPGDPSAASATPSSAAATADGVSPVATPQPSTTPETDSAAALAASIATAAVAEPAGAAPPPSYIVVLEVDGPLHFMRNRPLHVEGATAHRNRVLARRLGAANVLTVSTRDWVEVLGGVQESRDQLLVSLLAGTQPQPQSAIVTTALQQPK